MDNRERIISSLADDVDEQTREIAESLSIDEANKLATKIDEDIIKYSSVTPLATIAELRKTQNTISYKLNIAYQIWSTISV